MILGVIFIVVITNPISSLEAPNRLYRLLQSSHAEANAAVIRANRVFSLLSQMSRKGQIAMHLEFLNTCRRHLRGAEQQNYMTQWDYGTLDLLAVAMGKVPLLHTGERLAFLKGYGVRLILARSSVDGDAATAFSRPLPYTDLSSYRRVTERVRQGYYVITSSRRLESQVPP
jgi:hypothetical protein